MNLLKIFYYTNHHDFFSFDHAPQLSMIEGICRILMTRGQRMRILESSSRRLYQIQFSHIFHRNHKHALSLKKSKEKKNIGKNNIFLFNQHLNLISKLWRFEILEITQFQRKVR